MATLAGSYLADAIAPARFSPSVRPGGLPLAGGVTQDTVVIDVATRSHAGEVLPSFGAAAWFGRLQIQPDRIDFGLVRKAKQETIELYNAGDTDTTLDAIVSTGDEGLNLTGPSRPAAIPARQSLSFTLSVSVQGPSTIDATYTFDGASSDALLAVVGERLATRIWTIPPDWSRPVVERWQWRTDLQRSKSGAESRRAIYPHPRRGLEWRVVTDGIGELDRMISGWQTGTWAVPRWMDKARLTAAASAGDTALLLDTSVGEWRTDAQVVLLGASDAEAPVVAAVNAGSLDLDTPLEADWPAGTAVYPARLMRLPTSLQVPRPSAGVATATVQMLADADTETPYTADDSDTTFAGEPVYLEEPNRARAAPAGYTRDAERLDSQIGLVLIDDPDGDPIHRHDWQYLFGDRAEIDGFIGWLLARAGRANAFRYPTWSSDLRVVQPINPGDTSLVIEPLDWSRWYDGRANRDVVAVQSRAGTWHFAAITSAAIGGSVETLSLDRELVAAGGTAIQPADVRRACWLERVRLDTDRVELAWQTATVADATLQLAGTES